MRTLLALALVAATGCMVGVEDDAALDVDASVAPLTYSTVNSSGPSQLLLSANAPLMFARCHAMKHTSFYFNTTGYSGTQSGYVCDSTGTVNVLRVRCNAGAPPCTVDQAYWNAPTVPQCGNPSGYTYRGTVNSYNAGTNTASFTFNGQTHTCNTLASTYTTP